MACTTPTRRKVSGEIHLQMTHQVRSETYADHWGWHCHCCHQIPKQILLVHFPFQGHYSSSLGSRTEQESSGLAASCRSNQSPESQMVEMTEEREHGWSLWLGLAHQRTFSGCCHCFLTLNWHLDGQNLQELWNWCPVRKRTAFLLYSWKTRSQEKDFFCHRSSSRID